MKSPSTIIATIALFVSLTGGAYAGVQRLIGSAQIADHSIQLRDIHPRAVKTLHGARGATGDAGAAGAAGANGMPGDPGPPGPQGLPGSNATAGISGWQIVQQNVHISQVNAANGVAYDITCPTGKALLSGGYAYMSPDFSHGLPWDYPGPGPDAVVYSSPDGGSSSTYGSWQYGVKGAVTADGFDVKMFAVCADNAP